MRLRRKGNGRFADGFSNRSFLRAGWARNVPLFIDYEVS
jgi:hypothetical protein